MIRTSPQHNTANPAGQVVNKLPALNQDKSLGKAIEEYKDEQKADRKLSSYDYLELQRFFNSMNSR
jgi:hypothetical protein